MWKLVNIGSLRKNITLLFAVFFLVATLVLVWHHHDRSIQWSSCSICKIKSALSGTFNKVKTGAPPAVAVLLPAQMVIHSTASVTTPDDRLFLPSILLSFAHSNKAPPPPALF